MADRGRRALDLLVNLPRGRPLHGVEVGVLVGAFSRALLNFNRTLHLILVDNWKERPEGLERTKQNLEPYGNRVFIMHSDSVAAAEALKDGSFDFVYIDADHSYESTKADLHAWAPKVKPGGLLCGHDFNHPAFPGVKRAVKEFAKRLPERDPQGRKLLRTGFDGNWFLTLPVDQSKPLAEILSQSTQPSQPDQFSKE